MNENLNFSKILIEIKLLSRMVPNFFKANISFLSIYVYLYIWITENLSNNCSNFVFSFYLLLSDLQRSLRKNPWI